MKPRILAIAMLALCGAGCSTTASPDKQGSGLRIDPVETVRHGAPNAESYYRLGRYYQGQHRFEQAEDAYRKAIAVDARSVDAFNALASLYAQRGDTERAAKMLEKLTALVPEAAYLHNNLGYAYYLLGRQEDAYASVRRALVLDAASQRAWANLGLIAAKESEPMLAQAIARSDVAALPPALARHEQPTPAATPTRMVATSGAGFAVEAKPMSLPPAEDRTVAGAGSQGSSSVGEPAIVVAVALEPPPQALPGIADQRPEGRFVLLTAREERRADAGPIEIGMPADPLPAPAAARLEVSNGNGVSRFASRFSAMLRRSDIGVARITNYPTFSVPQTIVEYQEGYRAQAQAIMSRAGLAARLVHASGRRPGVDVRIVLGRDAASVCTPECAGTETRARMVSATPESAGG